jgi:CheY-like chemotaxis protein
LLDWQMPGADGIEVTRTLQHEADPAPCGTCRSC